MGERAIAEQVYRRLRWNTLNVLPLGCRTNERATVELTNTAFLRIIIRWWDGGWDPCLLRRCTSQVLSERTIFVRYIMAHIDVLCGVFACVMGRTHYRSRPHFELYRFTDMGTTLLLNLCFRTAVYPPVACVRMHKGVDAAGGCHHFLHARPQVYRFYAL